MIEIEVNQGYSHGNRIGIYQPLSKFVLLTNTCEVSYKYQHIFKIIFCYKYIQLFISLYIISLFRNINSIESLLLLLLSAKSFQDMVDHGFQNFLSLVAFSSFSHFAKVSTPFSAILSHKFIR